MILGTAVSYVSATFASSTPLSAPDCLADFWGTNHLESRMRRFGHRASMTLAIVGVCLFMLVLTARSARASGPTSGATFVALGDSYSAGEGLGPFQHGTANSGGAQRNTCHRSAGDAFADLSPALVLPQITSRGFWACSGATVSDIETVPGQNGTPAQYGQPAQVSTVGATTRYMTLTVGGDDLGFGDVGHSCAEAQIHNKVWRFSGTSCASQVATETAKIPALTKRLEGLYASLLSRSASNSELVVAGYPKILPDSYNKLGKVRGTPFCTFDHLVGVGSIGMPVPDAQEVASFEAKLNGAIKRAVDATAAMHPWRIGYVDLYPTSVPRNCHGKTGNATVAGVEISPSGNGIGPGGFISTATFHPTKAGQKVYARAIQAEFMSLAQTIFVSNPSELIEPAHLGENELPPTLGAFENYFGKPASIKKVGSKQDPDCLLSWPRRRVTAEFFHGYGGLQGGSCVSGSGTYTVTFGSGWRTSAGLAVGDRVARVKQIYPGADQHGSDWTLISDNAGWGIVKTLQASVKNGTVVSLILAGPESWDE